MNPGKDVFGALEWLFFSWQGCDEDVHVFVGQGTARFTYLTRGRVDNEFDSSCHLVRILDLMARAEMVLEIVLENGDQKAEEREGHGNVEGTSIKRCYHFRIERSWRLYLNDIGPTCIILKNLILSFLLLPVPILLVSKDPREHLPLDLLLVRLPLLPVPLRQVRFLGRRSILRQITPVKQPRCTR